MHIIILQDNNYKELFHCGMEGHRRAFMTRYYHQCSGTIYTLQGILYSIAPFVIVSIPDRGNTRPYSTGILCPPSFYAFGTKKIIIMQRQALRVFFFSQTLIRVPSVRKCIFNSSYFILTLDALLKVNMSTIQQQHALGSPAAHCNFYLVYNLQVQQQKIGVFI